MRKFLQELDHKLRPLKREERKKYLFSYEEIILDKLEQGITEETAVSELGNVDKIATEILNYYVELNDNHRTNNLKYFNKVYFLIDFCTFLISGIIAYIIYKITFGSDTNIWRLPFSSYLIVLLYVLPCYLCAYYYMRIYVVKNVRQQGIEAMHVIFGNLVACILWALILYITKQYLFPRIILLIFLVVNSGLLIFVRNLFFSKKHKFESVNNVQYKLNKNSII